VPRRERRAAGARKGEGPEDQGAGEDGFVSALSQDFIVTILTNGIDKDMKSFKDKLSDAAIRAVAGYTKELADKARKAGACGLSSPPRQSRPYGRACLASCVACAACAAYDPQPRSPRRGDLASTYCQAWTYCRACAPSCRGAGLLDRFACAPFPSHEARGSAGSVRDRSQARPSRRPRPSCRPSPATRPSSSRSGSCPAARRVARRSPHASSRVGSYPR